MILQKDLIRCPSGTPGNPAIEISLGKILQAEARQMEVAAVTPQKAPELLQAFNKAWSDLHKMMTVMTYEKNVAEKNANKRKAVVLLEIAPKKLEEAGLNSSVDHREAVLALDTEYQEALEVVNQIGCLVEYIKGKLKSFENSFTSVKKIMGEDAYNMQGQSGPVYGGIDEDTEVGKTEYTGFGRSKY